MTRVMTAHEFATFTHPDAGRLVALTVSRGEDHPDVWAFLAEAVEDPTSWYIYAIDELLATWSEEGKRLSCLVRPNAEVAS